MRPSKPDALTEAACRQRAVALLARRDHSRRELERKLAAQGFSPELVGAALSELERKGLFRAERFAGSFVRSRVAKGQGPVRIRAELAERGVEDSSALAAEDVDWVEAARTVRRKRFGAAVPSDFKERARQARFLQYRGFDSAQIKAALELADDSD